jgi:ketosteroid isomerase-like protein
MNPVLSYSSNRRKGLVLLALFVAVLPALAEPKDDEKEIMRLTEVINAAWLKHDTATISPLIADDMQAWSFKGARRGKAELLRAVEKSDEGDTKVDDAIVRVFGDAAIYTARITDTGKRANGETFSITSVVTNTWIRRAGKWQIVAEHQSVLPK